MYTCVRCTSAHVCFVQLHVHERTWTPCGWPEMWTDVNNICLAYLPARNLETSFWSTTNKKLSVEPWWRLSWTERPTQSMLASHDNTQTYCIDPAPHVLFNLPCLLTVPIRSAQQAIKIHASPWRSRSCFGTQASSDHPRWCVPHLASQWLALAVCHGLEI